MQPYCRSIYPVPRRDFDPGSLRSRLGFFSTTPRSVLDTYSTAVEETIQNALSGQNFDLVIASQFDMAIYANVWQLLPAIFEEAEIGFYRDQITRAEALTSQLRAWMTWWKHQRYLSRLLAKFAACTVVSEQERSLMAGICPKLTILSVIPNCVDLQDYSTIHEEPEPNTLIFTGSFRYEPNYEAMVWFVERVFPQLLESVPEARLIITGDHAGRKLPSSKNITLTGYLPDIKTAIARSWVSLAPIHSGGGTRLKILEALALRTPVVATTKGAEGLDLTAGEHLLIADDPQAYASACVQLLNNRTRRAELAENAYLALQARYSWQAVMPRFLRLVETAANGSAV
jgi:glycosyltransferase involved in cell wall biosynthesis